jgi:hypothetical protein
MMREMIVGVLLTVMIPVGLHAQTLTLACEGKMNSTPVHDMGIVVDLASRTVSGFGDVAPVTEVNAAIVSFGDPGSTVWGVIDRVTGGVSTVVSHGAVTLNYELVCKPARRLF